VRAFCCTAAASSLPAHDVREIRQARRSDGPATILAIGKENPVNSIPQDEFVDWYFRVTNCEHLTKLKAKMKRICKYADPPWIIVGFFFSRQHILSSFLCVQLM
jgi:hypothetical protein